MASVYWKQPIIGLCVTFFCIIVNRERCIQELRRNGLTPPGELSSSKLGPISPNRYGQILCTRPRFSMYIAISLQFRLSSLITTEWLHERTKHLDIFLFSAHYSVVFYFRCSVYWWKGSVRF